jgi:hypothetical protein
MKMGDKNPIDGRWSHISEDELPLGPFTRVKEEPLLIPSDKISAVVPETGRLLA